MKYTSDAGSRPLDGIRSMFLVWSNPQGSHRSRFFAESLGMRLQHVYFTRRRGAFAAALKYPVQALLTIWVVLRHRPNLVFVQDPPTLAAFMVWLCKLLLPFRIWFVIDSHTQRQELVEYAFLLPIRRFVARHALTNIVSNSYLSHRLAEWNAPALVMEDPPLLIADTLTEDSLDGEFNVVWVNAGAQDEPRRVFFEAARNLPKITFYVTSDYNRNTELREYQMSASENVCFTGYLPDNDFYQLLKSSDAVLTLTAWDHTLQQGACEAMWLGRPVITSDWPMLRKYFSGGTLFVDNTVESLISALQEVRANHDVYAAGIRQLAPLRRKDWDHQVDALLEIINNAIEGEVSGV